MPAMQIQIRKPRNEEDFELAIKTLFQCIYKDRKVKRHGRRGQEQYGVDIFELRGGNANEILGVQCKLKGDGKNLTEAEVREEVEKAFQFRPPLSEYIIVTTAPTDGRLDRLALELSAPESTDHPLGMGVSVWGWETLQEEIQQHPEAIRAFDPSYTPWSDEINKKLDDILSVVRPRTHTFEPVIDASAIHDTLESQINDYAPLVRSDPSTALKLLERLLERDGSTASNHIRFRIVSNIAGCHLNLGNEEVAAKGFTEAFDLDPENPKAVANKALALLLDEDWHNLKSFAEDYLQEHSDNARLAAYYIHSLIVDKAIHDPLKHVPEAVRNSTEVAVANVRWLMKRPDAGVWREAATAAHKMHPQDDELSELYACALLEQVVTESVFVYGRDLSEVDLENVQTAIGIYELLWSKICDSSQRVRDENISIPINLMAAYRISDQADEAIKTGNEALVQFSQNKELKICLAAALVEQGDSDRALDLISGLDGNHQVMTMRLEIAIANKDWITISDLVSNHLDSFEERRTFPAAIGVLAKVELALEEDRYSILKAQQGEFDNDALALIVLAQCSRMHGFDNLARSYLIAAIEAVDKGDDGFNSRTSVAREAMVCEQYNTVVDVLYEFVPRDRMSPALLLLAEALVSIYPIRQRTIDFFEQLPPHIRALHDIIKLEGIMHINGGNPQEAIDPLSKAFEGKTCADNLTLLVTAHLRAGDREAGKLLLSDPNIDTLPGSSLDRLQLCYFLIHIGENERAIDLAYEALVEGVNSPDVVAKYLKVVLELPPHFKGGICGEVAKGLWVRFTSQDDKTYEVIVGESSDRLWGERGDLSNAFISQALGKKVNDQFEYTNASGTTNIWTVSEIKPRWLQAFHYLGEVLGQRYPEVRDVAVLPIDNDNIQAILDKVRHHSEAIHDRANLYLKGEAPMSLAAWGVAGGPVAFADHLVLTGKNIQVSYGSESEYSEAHLWLDNNGDSGVVIDAFTAWRAAELGVLPILRKYLGALLIPVCEMAILQGMVQSRDDFSSRETMYLNYHEGKCYRQIITPEEQNDRLNKMKGLIADIEKECKIETVVIPDELPDAVEQIIYSPAGNAFICAFLARERNLLLLCEDMIMRQWARALLDAKGVWIQAVLSSALRNETLAHDVYSDVLVQLALRRHCHISVSAPDLLSVFERDKSPNLTQLEILCADFGNKAADPDSHIEIAIGFINRIWADNRYKGEQLTEPTSIVLNALLLNGNSKRGLWAAPIYAKLNSAPLSYFARWCREHPSPCL